MASAFLIVGRDAEGRPLGRPVEENPYTGVTGGERFGISPDEIAIMPRFALLDPQGREYPPRPAGEGAPLPLLSPGDVVLAELCMGWPLPDGTASALVCVTLPNASPRSLMPAAPPPPAEALMILGRADDDAAACALASDARSGASSLDALRGMSWLRGACEAELVRRQPDEGLVMAWREADGSVIGHVFHHRGESLGLCIPESGRSCEDIGIGDPEEPGLWLARDLKWWTSRDRESVVDDDAGLEGVLERITWTDAAARFGTPEADLRIAATEEYPFILEVDLDEAVLLPEVNPEAAAPAPAR